MSLTTDLKSVGILTAAVNKWPSGDSNQNMGLIVQDVQALATAVDGIEAGTITLTAVEAGDGTVALPSYTFLADLDTGFYRIGANNVGLSLNALKAYDFGTTQLAIVSTTDATTSTTGSIKTAGGMGIAKALYVGTSVNATTYITSGDGTVALPAIGPVSDPDTGMYSIGANNLGFAVNATKIIDISTSGLNLALDATFAKEVNHIISVATTTTAATAGGNLTIGAGVGATTGAGGNISVSGGAGVAASGSNSGTATLTTGAAGTHTTGTAGNGGNIAITGANGGAASGAAGIGGNGSNVTITVGAGGASSSATGGATGTAGAFIVLQGNGGAAAGTGVAGGLAAACSVTTGDGGASTHAAGGAGGAAAALTIKTGNGGAVTNAAVAGGVGGALALTAGNAGAGSTAGSAGGAVTLTAGNGVGTAGAAGNVVLTPGTTSMTTVSPVVINTSNIILKPLGTGTIATGNTLTGKQLVDGYFNVTGATGNVQFPTASAITTAIGATPAGTSFLFVVNVTGMTAANVATLTVNTGVTFLKQFNTTDVATATLATITNTAGVHVGTFRCTFDTTTTCVISRMG